VADEVLAWIEARAGRADLTGPPRTP